MPQLNGDLLKKILLIHGCARVGPNYFKDQGLIITKPVFKSLLMFVFSHLIDSLPISPGERMNSYKIEKNFCVP